MRLLILTQKVSVNDDVLGFMHGWIAEFARHWDSIKVICLEKHEFHLPSNVEVFSLGKEVRPSRLKYLWNFYRQIWRWRRDYDAVFVHMNYEYLILGGLLWRLWGKTRALWYAHGHVPRGLKWAERLANVVFTSTASGFRLPSKKVRVIGQGIDVTHFPDLSAQVPGQVFQAVGIGRLSPVKDYDTVLTALRIILDRGQAIKIAIAGGAGTPEQQVYAAKLRARAIKENLTQTVAFVGPIANPLVPDFLAAHPDVFINSSRTGSLDKAGLEAMACGLPVLTPNEAYHDLLGSERQVLMYPGSDSSALASKLSSLITLAQQEPERWQKLRQAMRQIVVEHHSLPRLVRVITESLTPAQ